jgi:transposase
MRKPKNELSKFKNRPKRPTAEEKRNANILALHKEGVGFHQIAKLFEMSKEDVENICRPGKSGINKSANIKGREKL